MNLKKSDFCLLLGQSFRKEANAMVATVIKESNSLHPMG